jgi:soluble lytic murein transglycosylase-like protein
MIVDAPVLPPAFSSGEVPAICVAYTAAKFDLPPNLILAIMKTEAGRVGMESRNTNGSFDLGPMQVNTVWLTVLEEHGVTRAALRDDGCLNVWVGGWILKSGLISAKSWWRGVGRYHSATTRPDRDLNGNYALRVWRHLQSIDKLQVSWWGIPRLDPINNTALSLTNETPPREKQK